MPKTDDHVIALDKKITDLSNALALLGKGTDLKDLIRIIRFPGFTTPAEFVLISSILDSMQAQVGVLATMSSQLLAGSKLVTTHTAQ